MTDQTEPTEAEQVRDAVHDLQVIVNRVYDAVTTDQPTYPYRSGDRAVLGPDVIASADGETITWQGSRYRRDRGPQQPEHCDHESQVIDHQGAHYWACLKCGTNLGRIDTDLRQRIASAYPATATELVDLVDQHGTLVRTGVPRGPATRQPGLYMRIVVVVITHRDGRVLVTQRPHDADMAPSAIDHVCGAIHSGETPEAAARREAREETGADLDTLRLVQAGVNTYGRDRYLFAATTSTPADQLTTDGEWVGYMTAEQLREDAEQGREFVKGFFDDLDAAQAASGTGVWDRAQAAVANVLVPKPPHAVDRELLAEEVTAVVRGIVQPELDRLREQGSEATEEPPAFAHDAGPTDEAQFGSPECTCIPWTRKGGTARYCGPDETVDEIAGWERRRDCPHHAPPAHDAGPSVRECALTDRNWDVEQAGE